MAALSSWNTGMVAPYRSLMLKINELIRQSYPWAPWYISDILRHIAQVAPMDSFIRNSISPAEFAFFMVATDIADTLIQTKALSQQ